MRKSILAATLGLLLTGCSADLLGQIEGLALNAEQIAFVEEHVETTLQAEDELGEVVLAAAYGEYDLAGASYDPPTEENGWVGTITKSGQFSFGEGDLTIQFIATGDGLEVDPYADGFDPGASYDELIMDSEIMFSGEDNEGMALDIAGDLLFNMSPTTGDLLTTTVNGDFDIVHGAYETTLNLDEVTFEMDRASQDIQNVTGDISGVIDVPGFAADAAFNIEAQGTSLLVTVDAALTQLQIPVDLL